MKIPLDHFEEMFGEAILDRGLSYYANGHVTDVAKISDKEFEVTVVGTEEYLVYLKIECFSAVEYACDCAYDHGPVCKHIIASLYYLRENEFYLGDPVELPLKKSESKSVAQQINEVLERLSDRELKEFIVNQGKNDKQFRNLFLSTFSYVGDNLSKEFYQEQINSIAHASTDRHGFIGWHEMNKFSNAIDPIISNADKQYEEKNYKIAFYIAAALLEEMIEALQFSDDSSGSIGGIIEEALEMLHNIALKRLPKDFRDEFLNYCFATFKKELFEGWDWHLDILRIAFRLIETEAEADRILKCLDSVKETYLMDQAQLLKLEILAKYKDKKVVNRFIDNHITNSSIRNAEIEKAIKSKDFERAIKLSEEGIEHDKKDRPGLVKDGYNWLLKVAQIHHDKPRIIEYARYLLIDNFNPQQDYYQILKKEVEPDKWRDFLEEIIEEVTAKDTRGSEGLVQKIYINEQWWDRLFLYLKQNVSLYGIEQNEQYLAADYSQELIQLYSQQLKKYVDKNIGRNYYQTACSYLRRMKILGGVKEVDRLIEMFRAKYKNRRALMDELNRV